ncbi:DUF2946 domain-containing protein [Caballeronia ptereochthonis]|uniref:Uncharacterized protein n=1 Tax=Caballeronia ptereochthonis TaxID=1777144 RepID=A0A158ACT6_9BURK|nr:DUF2946 domain-containing protein [Caballeronia ptereochthonis]SAK55529.1 hypothetical protein AWB83_01654 [Caballeronia ptereochthonis]
MTRNARNRFVAWLGIAVMWLAIVAPVISQTLAARHAADDPQAVLCAVDSPAAQYREGHETHDALAPDDTAHAGHHDAASHFDACSYCGLLAHNLPVINDVARDVERVERVARVASRADIDTVCTKSFNAACPRAPPVLS